MDSRDKIFAAIGSINYLFPPSSKADVFSIKYDMSVESIYENFTIWLLKFVPLRYTLSLVEEASERSLSGLPSWVPDLSVTTEREEVEMTVEVKPPGTSCTFSAVEGRQSLHVIGFRLGVIDSVDAVPVTDILPANYQHIRALSEFCREMNPDYPSGEGRVEALWRTLVMNSDRSRSGPPDGRRSEVAQESLGPSFRSLIRILVSMQVLHVLKENHISADGAISEILMAQFGIGQCDDTENPAKEMLPSKDEVTRCVLHNINLMGREEGRSTASDVLASPKDGPWGFINSLKTNSRRLFRTNDGWIGLAPRSTKVGDEVWSFKESPIPYILRPRQTEDGTYHYVGESYMYGVVAGGEPPDHQWTEAVLV